MVKADLPTQLSTHGQWWSNLATHRLHTEQCFDLRGRRIRHVVQNWFRLKFCDSASSRIACNVERQKILHFLQIPNHVCTL